MLGWSFAYPRTRALRHVFALGALASALLTPCGRARAHGEPPTPYALLAHDAEGALAVRLSAGIALRRAPERFQFVCPAAWGDEYAAPAAMLADGTIVLGAADGLRLLARDGGLAPHPAAAAPGPTTDLVRGEAGVFALRNTAQGSELLAVDAREVRVVWSDTRSWYSLAARGADLALLRASGTSVEQLVLAADGREIDRQTAAVAMPIDYVFARANGGDAYALLLFQSSRQLGTLRSNTFSKVAQGASSIAGPLSLGAATLLAIDGKLAELVQGAPVELEEPSYVHCLERAGELAYACTRDALAPLEGTRLGAPLFQLSWLSPPDLARVAEGRPRERCEYQWQDLRFDMLALGITLSEDAKGDAGAPPEDAGAGQGDAEDAGLEEPAPDDAPADEAPDAGKAKRRRPGGCSLTPLPAGSYRTLLLGALGLLVLSLRARTRRPRP